MQLFGLSSKILLSTSLRWSYRFLFDVVFVFSRKALAFSISSCILSVFVCKVTALLREKTFMAEVTMVTEH